MLREIFRNSLKARSFSSKGWRDYNKQLVLPDKIHSKALLISNSTIFGGSYFGHCGDIIANFLNNCGVKKVLFVPWALAHHDKYFGNSGTIQYDVQGQPVDHTGRPKARLSELGFDSTSIHHAKDPVKAVEEAEAIFIGGGNTFRLLRELQSVPSLIPTIQRRVWSGELPFISSSCGSTVAGATVHASICMPICSVNSFEGLRVVPFNISPHFQDPEPKSKLHDLGFNVSMEENREQRIRQYTDEMEKALPVVGLREGTLMEVHGEDGLVRLHGKQSARVFWPSNSPEEYQPGSRLDVLLKCSI